MLILTKLIYKATTFTFLPLYLTIYDSQSVSSSESVSVHILFVPFWSHANITVSSLCLCFSPLSSNIVMTRSETWPVGVGGRWSTEQTCSRATGTNRQTWNPGVSIKPGSAQCSQGSVFPDPWAWEH